MARKRISVTNESNTGRNTNFHDNYTGKDMDLNQFVKEIELGNYPKYHVRIVDGVKTPASNPDNSTNNNLD
ncbi:hypothetical protein [Clostridium sp. YIM B02506]|uniref:hypothetical protein n=1 Tax=Clostridium sp. YIM B02506 TaxID=2910680 RepID=UPI001EEF092F|nr:hypothetical protein [Clostridium sp. YIM B02506]